jgi:hypothetical protein
MDDNFPQPPGDGAVKPVIDIKGASFPEVVEAVSAALETYPNFVVLCGLPAGSDHRAIDSLVRAVAGVPPDGEMSFTTVQIDPAEATRPGAVTRYSRTHLALPSHTDSAFLEKPHHIVAFQMVRGDRNGGGCSTAVPVRDVVAELDESSIRYLRQAQFAFSREGLLPILWGNPGAESMRYYHAQVRTALAVRGEQAGPLEPLLDALDTVLAGLARKRVFGLADGEVLLLNNHKVLHGRTEMPMDSNRLMYRFRAHVAEPI